MKKTVITRFNHVTVLVNSKQMVQDMENRWICRFGELTPSEREDFTKFLNKEHNSVKQAC
jgi:hypothetical protein